MSVLIKGMEMPKEGCKDCPIVKRGNVFDICPFLKREVNGNVERGGKPYDCPLVHVPPHGQLIDADAICYQLEKLATIDGQPRAIRRARRMVETAPTIIPEEEGER